MRSAWLKLARAVEHLKELAASTRTFEAGDNYGYQRFDNATSGTDPLVRVQWHLRMRQPYPERWSVLIGDAVTNLRDTLDHAFWYAVTEHSGLPVHPTQIEFPLYRTKDRFDQKAKQLAALVRPEVWQVVEDCQPFHAGDEAFKVSLEILRWLSNVDKHRAVHPVSTNHVELGPLVVHADPPTDIVEEWHRDGIARDGDAIARLKFQRRLDTGNQDIVPTFTHTAALQICDDPEPAYRRLGEVLEIVKDNVLNALVVLSSHLELDLPTGLEIGAHYDAINAEAHGALWRYTDLDGNTTTYYDQGPDASSV